MIAVEDTQLRVRLIVERAGAGPQELPFVVGVIGDFVPASDRPLPALGDRHFLTVTPRNFDKVLGGLAPRIDLADLPDHLAAERAGTATMAVSLTMHALADFTPERLLLLIPAARGVLGLRASLAALKRDLWRLPAPVGGKGGAKDARAGGDPEGRPEDRPEYRIDEICDLTRAPDWSLDQRCQDLRALAGSVPLAARAACVARIDVHLAEIDARLARQVDAVLHHPAFQALERAWRSLHYLVTAIAAEAERQARDLVKIRMLPLSRAEMIDDLAQACVRAHGKITDIDRQASHLYELLYTHEYGQHGGEPYGVLVLDFDFDPHRRDGAQLSDLETLRALSLIAQDAFLPVLAGAAPGLLGRTDMGELGRVPTDLATHFASPRMAGWRALRHQDASRYLALTVPDCLIRAPLRANPARAWQIPHDERAERVEDHLWTGAAFPLAARIAIATLRFGWGVAFLGRANDGAGRVADLPLPVADPDSVALPCAPLRVHLTESQEQDLRDAGLIPLMPEHLQPAAAFFSAFSLYQPRPRRDPPERIADPADALGEGLSAQLPFIMAVSRVAHCLKVMMREQIGGGASKSEIESTLNRWLSSYVAYQDDAAPETRARRPLREAGVRLHEAPGEPGVYKADMVIKPHFQIEELDFNLNLTTRLRVGGA